MRGELVEVACTGATHGMALIGDDVVLIDHDEASERVLQALGGEVSRCLWLAATWRDAPWPDAVPCLLLDDDGAAALAAGKAAAAAGLQRRAGARSHDVVERLLTSAALVGLPRSFRQACGQRALAAGVEAWRQGRPMAADDRELLEHELEPLLARRLHAEGRHLPPGGRPLRVHIVAPGAPPALVPGRRAWQAHVPIGTVAWLVTTSVPLSRWFEGTR